MPVSVVHSLEDEQAWETAKQIAANQYPQAVGSNYWRMVMSIFEKMTHYIAKSQHGDHDPIWRMAR
jgi:hypothetical protein